MPRPIPLKNLSSGVVNPEDNGQLTPRTPYSRTARLEGGFAQLQVNDLDDEHTFAQQQSAPLLHSSASTRFSGPQSSKPESSARREPLTPVSRAIAFFGIALATVLLLLIGVSFTNQELLFHYLGLPLPLPSHDPPHAAQTTSLLQHPTSFYPNFTHFPLSGAQYRDECSNMMGSFMKHGDYWDLPNHHHGAAMDAPHSNDTKICQSTITYMLDGHVGLAADLALMAQVAALARERNRTFFVDDTHWNRGWWSEYFEDVTKLQPGPEPGCLRPPPEELVACPRTARHWVVSSLTAKYHLGHEFENHYENPYYHELNRQKPTFGFAEKSLSTTIRPGKEMIALIRAAREEVLHQFPVDNEPLTVDEHFTGDKAYISVHIRRGDRVPHGWMYHRKPIPIQEYLDALEQVFNRNQEDLPNRKSVVIYVASDSPAELENLSKLYTSGPVFSLAKSTNPDLKALASPSEYHQEEFNHLSADARRRATMGALVDLALVTGLWDVEMGLHHHSTICTVSSNFGRLAAVGLGWDLAFGGVDEMGSMNNSKKRWVDVDLKGSELPVWKPFELF